MSGWRKGFRAFMVMIAVTAGVLNAFDRNWSAATWAFIAALWIIDSSIWMYQTMRLEKNNLEAIKIIQVVLDKVDELEETGEWRVKE